MAYTFKQTMLPLNKYSIKSPFTMSPQYITVHNTANDAPAENEIKYMIGNNNQVSFHVAIDDKTAIQAIPFNRNAWHCGDGQGTGNMKSIGVEICYSKSGGTRYVAAEENAVQYIAKLLKDFGWGIDRVKKHQDWSGKYCPHRILSENRWNSFLKRIESALAALNKKSEGKPMTPKNTLTTTGKADFEVLLKEMHKQKILSVDHGGKVETMSDGEALSLLISVVKRTTVK